MVCLELERSYIEPQYGYNDNQHEGSSNYLGCSNYFQDEWTKVAETTLPLKQSYLAYVNNQRQMSPNSDSRHPFQASLDLRSRQISKKVIWVNLVSLIVNLVLALVALYYAFVDDSSAITAFGADCLLDLISSAIVLWRYNGNLSSEYMHAREQIACIYLGALFELSALGIIIKAISDIVAESNGTFEREAIWSVELVYLASAATLACIILTIFKSSLYKELRDKSIFLDVINTLISTIFAISIVMSQALMYVDSSFWYLDPVLSIILALFMMAFGLKVLHQNLNILKPIVQQSNYYYSSFRSPQNSRRHNGDNLDRSSINIINSSEANIYKELDIKNKLNYGTNSGERNNKSWQGAQYPVVAIV